MILAIVRQGLEVYSFAGERLPCLYIAEQCLCPNHFRFITKRTNEVNFMSNELFVELSDDQQEIVTGGLAVQELLNISNFTQDQVAGTSFATAGPTGASAGSSGAAQHINSDSISFQSAIAF
jgi:hypothetical protein